MQQAYNDLLDRTGGDPSNPDVRTPKQRIRVLKSLHSVLIERRNELERQRSYTSYQAFRTKEKQEVRPQSQNCQRSMHTVLITSLLSMMTSAWQHDCTIHDTLSSICLASTI